MFYCLPTKICSSHRLNDFNLLVDEEEDLDESEENALLQYCFEDLYGANYGFRTLVAYDEAYECIEGVTCDSNGESIENDNGGHNLRYKKGALIFLLEMTNDK